jgi:hypothetical protein
MSNCDACKEIKKTEPVPYIVHESAQARNERTVKRLVVALIVLALLWFATIGIGVYAWMQYDYESEETVTEYKQDGEGLNIIGDRNTAGIYDESERDD